MPFEYPSCETPAIFIKRPIEIRGFKNLIGPIFINEF